MMLECINITSIWTLWKSVTNKKEKIEPYNSRRKFIVFSYMSSSPIHPHTYKEVDLVMGYTLHCGLCWLPGTKKWVEFILTSKSSEVRYKLVLLTNFFKSCLGKWTQKDEQYGWLRIWGFLGGFSFFWLLLFYNTMNNDYSATQLRIHLLSISTQSHPKWRETGH